MQAMTHPTVKSIRGEYIRGGCSADLFAHLVKWSFCRLRTGMNSVCIIFIHSYSARPQNEIIYTIMLLRF